MRTGVFQKADRFAFSGKDDEDRGRPPRRRHGLLYKRLLKLRNAVTLRLGEEDQDVL